MVDVGKREDRMLDFINDMKGRINFALVQIEIYRESGGLTAHEMEMLNAIQGHLSLTEQEDVA